MTPKFIILGRVGTVLGNSTYMSSTFKPISDMTLTLENLTACTNDDTALTDTQIESLRQLNSGEIYEINYNELIQRVT